jgi:methylase of polypeptide subunit release factors
MIYLEINPKYDLKICQLLHDNGFGHTEIIRDLSGKNRMITGLIEK